MLLKYIKIFLIGGVKPRITLNLNLMRYCNSRRWYGVARFLAARMQLKYGVFISHKATINGQLDIRHPVGIVIGEGVEINGKVVIYQGVTIGGARLGDADKRNYPVIGDNCTIFAGAVIVGNISIGNNCTVGANSVVLQNVPDGCTAVGAPARILRN